MNSIQITAVVLGLGMGLSGCVQSQAHLSSDFGRAVHENIVAQIADPDANYVGIPAPGSEGHRVALAQKRYVTGKVIKPIPAAAYKVGVVMDSGGSGGDDGGDAGAAPAPSAGPQ